MFRRTTYTLFSVTLFCLAAAACTAPTKSEKIIQEDTYIDLLAELHLLNAIDETYPDSTLREEGLDTILQNYNISVEAFEESHSFYHQDVEGQRERLEEANRRLRNEYDRMNQVRRELREEQNQAQQRKQREAQQEQQE
ncbi:MAG: DUF4296 domain-containing protein [Balneolales bacterium]